jgi:integrase
VVDEALQYLGTVRNYAPATIDSYTGTYDQFRHWLHAHDLPDDIDQFTGDNLFRFTESLAQKGQKASTIVIRLHALSTIANTLMKLKDDRGKPYLETNPTRTFEWPTVDTPETKFLLPEELAAFLAVPRPVGESIARDLLIDTALRVSELCRVKVGDLITVEGRTALAVTVKGRGRRVQRRHVPLSKPVATALFEYLVSREIHAPQHPDSRDQPLLVNSEGRAWIRTSLSSLMVRIGRQAGVTRFRVSAHKLRHTANVVSRMARLADGSKLDRWTRSQLLSHRNPASLDRYEHLLPDELFEAREAQRRGLTRYLGAPDETGVP